jgi:hypothetical protein
MEVSDPYVSVDDHVAFDDTATELDGTTPPAPAGDNAPPALPVRRYTYTKPPHMLSMT